MIYFICTYDIYEGQKDDTACVHVSECTCRVCFMHPIITAVPGILHICRVFPYVLMYPWAVLYVSFCCTGIMPFLSYVRILFMYVRYPIDVYHILLLYRTYACGSGVPPRGGVAEGAADAAAAHHRGRVGEGGGAVAALYGERPRDAGAPHCYCFSLSALCFFFVFRFCCKIATQRADVKSTKTVFFSAYGFALSCLVLLCFALFCVVFFILFYFIFSSLHAGFCL